MNNSPLQKVQYTIPLLFAAITLSYAPVFASVAAPGALCRITGVIESVTFKDAYNESCLKEPYGCPTDMELSHPARYYLDININSVSYISGKTNFKTCENTYPIGGAKNVFIDKDKVKVGDIFSANQKIEGIVRSSIGNSFDSYDLITGKDVLGISKISEKLIGENYKVDNISLQADRRTYEVAASKNGKLFFFVPIHLDFQITVDATAGEIKMIKKPWWAFLARY